MEHTASGMSKDELLVNFLTGQLKLLKKNLVRARLAIELPGTYNELLSIIDEGIEILGKECLTKKGIIP